MSQENRSFRTRGKKRLRLVRYITVLILCVLFLNSGELFADKYAGEIFRIGAGVRNYALGNTGLTDVKSSALAYWNPALLAETIGERSSFELLHSEEFMGLVTYDTFSGVWGKEQRYSLVISRIAIDDVPLTKLPNPDKEPSVDNQPYQYKSVTNSDYIAYFGFYRQLGSLVIGFSPKFAYRHLAETSGYGIGADVSTYLTYGENLLIGIKLRDFFTTQVFWSNGTNELVRPSLDLEAGYRFPLPILNTQSRLVVGTEVLAEDREEAATNSVGIFSLDYHFGLEIPLPEYVTIYAGYDIRNFTTGLSLYLGQFDINYSFKHDTEIDNSHRISLGLRY